MSLTHPLRLYVASSWRNYLQPAVVDLLRELGHEVYDFRNPAPGVKGFAWSDIDPAWREWTFTEYIQKLNHYKAVDGFTTDFDAMLAADACVMVLPCGRSANLEAGWFVGKGKPLHIIALEREEPDLMYKMATGLHASLASLLKAFTIAPGEVS